MPALNPVHFDSSALTARGADLNLSPPLVARQDGIPAHPTGRPSDWVGPPPWVVRPTGRPPFPSESASSSSSPDPSESIIPLPGPSASSSPASVDDNAATQVGSSRGSGTPVGAIVGGVLGALALVAAAILLWWFLRRRKAKQAKGQEKLSGISPFRTDFERQREMQDASGRLSPQPRNSFQTTSTLRAASPTSQKGYLKSIHSIQRSASTSGSYTTMETSTVVSPTSTTTEDPQVIQAIRTLQTFLQPRMERIPEDRSGVAAAAAGFVEPASPPPPAYEESSSSGGAALPRRSMEKIRIENQ